MALRRTNGDFFLARIRSLGRIVAASAQIPPLPLTQTNFGRAARGARVLFAAARAALTGSAAGAAAIVAGSMPAVASHPDDNLRRQLRSLLDYLRTDTKCTVGTHYDRQMIGNEIMAMLGEGGEPFRGYDDCEVRLNSWGIPEFYGRHQS